MYPLIASFIQKKKQNRVISTYKKEIKEQDEKEREQVLKSANIYNLQLYEQQQLGMWKIDEKLLRFSNGDVIGVISIPKINLNCPIYNSVEEKYLSVGIGHLANTSFPIGGEHTHCVLTGHRGLPNAKLFTRLDELEVGDLFFVESLGNTCIYKVKEILVIQPEDTSVFQIKEGNDLVSLVTCTPYGINSHRLVVVGERTELEKKEMMNIKPQIGSAREVILAVMPFGMVGMILWYFIMNGRKGKSGKKK